MKIRKTLDGGLSMESLRWWMLELARAFQGGISFGTTFTADNFSLGYGAGPTANIDRDINIKCFKASGTTPTPANTTFTVTSTSQFFKDGHVPIGVFTASVDQAAIIYSITIGSWTKSSVSLACNVASVNYRIILI